MKKKWAMNSPLLHRSLSATFGSSQHLFSRLTKIWLVSVHPLSSIAPQHSFHAFVEKTVKYSFVQYMQIIIKKKQPTGCLATRFHWWLFHRNMLASPSASCGSIQGCWDLQSQFWNFSAHTQPCLNVSSLQLHPLWCWSPHHSSYTSQGRGQAEQIHSHLPSTLFLLALWWELRRWRERWASQWRWLITTQVRGLFVLLSFLNVISTGGNWERTERQNVIWANNKWLIYKKLTNNNNNKQTKKISWSCQNGTVKKNCKLNICGLFLRVVTVEGNKHSLVNTKNKFTKFSCHVFNIV